MTLDWARAAAAKAPGKNQSIGGLSEGTPVAPPLELRRHPGRMVERSDVRRDEVRLDHKTQTSQPEARDRYADPRFAEEAK